MPVYVEGDTALGSSLTLRRLAACMSEIAQRVHWLAVLCNAAADHRGAIVTPQARRVVIRVCGRWRAVVHYGTVGSARRRECAHSVRQCVREGVRVHARALPVTVRVSRR
jgi:hypothetical protein